ncbi:MAG: phosphodiester glycosidase family protein [Bacillota bacterium]|jgi:exopolysaccharide biosynthesis protein|nr:phosphodiester glycosidase family protein [Bacillota bacterium]MDD3298458.1 phosphodiester glycosidase family protein [Bacillota bacterium]MDD3850776.1 phosphodiester glycosidase family protein [Bacillota bacterium]MDD4707308.1 phosphodiester glycosidase family protein [Bacillota bacterium]
MYRINYLFAFLAAPFLALFLVCLGFVEDSIKLEFPIAPLEEGAAMLQQETNILKQSIVDLGLLARMQEDTFSEQYESLSALSEKSVSHRKLSDDIYEQKILDMLGPTVSAHISDNNEIKIFKLAELGYRGFIAKVKLFQPKSFKVVLAQNTLGKLETTSEAAKRTGAILAINGGGFYTEVRNGETYAQMIGNTVIGGKLVEPFNGYPGDLFFAGINKKGQVIGGVPQTEKELTALKPYQGVSFIPVLLKDGKKVEIPEDWKTTNQPRTIIGKYANDDLIMIVIDGRQGDWSVGVTLEHLQDKLLELGVKEAYNLDGGGSSAMYFNGVVLNRPSDGKERPVVNNIVVLP